jgi:hypothetical protein
MPYVVGWREYHKKKSTPPEKERGDVWWIP